MVDEIAPLGTPHFLVGMCRAGLPKVGSRERVSLKNEGSWERKFGNFASLEPKFWPKTRLKIQFFFKVENGGHMSGTLMVHWYARCGGV